MEERTRNELQIVLDEKNSALINQIVDQDDAQQITDLVNLFNLNHMKKQMIRSATYNQLLDHIMGQMEERVTKRADQFSNKDLLDYMNAMGAAMEKAQKQLGDINATPPIQINQQNNIVNINNEADDLDRESRKRVMDAVSSILARLNTNTMEPVDSEENLVYVDNSDESETEEADSDTFENEED